MLNKSSSSSKLLKIGLLFLIVVGVWFYAIEPWIEKSQAIAAIEGNADLMLVYEEGLVGEEKIKENKDISDWYFAAAFKWKTLGDNAPSGNEYFYKRAIKVLDNGKKREGSRSALLYLNAGNIYKGIGEPEKAEANYKIATDMNPGDSVMWIARIDLWRYWDEKKPEEVLALIDSALRTLTSTLDVSVQKASYLAEIGHYEEALNIYEAVHAAVPEKEGIDVKIQTLKYKIEEERGS